MTSTALTPTAAINGPVIFTLPLTLLIGLGTGVLSPSYWPPGTGGTVNQYNLQEIARFDHGGRHSEAVSTAADDIDHIKTSLKLTTTELAKYLGVSRQAIYDWRSGGHVKSHNITKLENLRAAAGVISASNASLSSLQINRKLSGGRSLLETISIGGDGYEAAQSLVNMLRREAQQRQDRSGQLVERRPIRDSAFGRGLAAL